MTDESELPAAQNIKVAVRNFAEDARYVKCPRCWQYHRILLNFDGLCDRCCDVILKEHPGHESVPFIRASLEAQERYFRGKR